MMPLDLEETGVTSQNIKKKKVLVFSKSIVTRSKRKKKTIKQEEGEANSGFANFLLISPCTAQWLF